MSVVNLLSIASQGGWTVAIVGWSIVFAALVLLVIVFVNLPKLMQLNLKKKLHKEGKPMTAAEELDMEGNVGAAIALALHLHLAQQHDDESNVITIKKITKNYSPWSSKIYGVNNQPR